MQDEQIYKEILEIKKSVKKIQKYLFWNSFWNWAKVITIILIIVLGFVYLPKFLEEFRIWLMQIQKNFLIR